MEICDLYPSPFASNTSRRVGRGPGSGRGKTSGRGQKGQWSRSGGGVRRGFEGGQVPLTRRIPKRGFNNIFASKFAEVNVQTLNDRFNDGDKVTTEALLATGVIKNAYDGVKVLGTGEITKKLNVELYAFSASAREKIQAAGGTAEEV